MSRRRAAFIDRDGVINALVPDPDSGLPESPLHPDEVRLLPGVAEALRSLAAADWLMVGVSNQPAAAKGKTSMAQLQAVQSRVVDLLAAEGAHFDDFRICFHHPDGVVPELTRECACRKPAPGMLLDAATELAIDLARSWMIGDTDADLVAGKAAGCQTILVQQRESGHKRAGEARPDVAVPDLGAGVALLLADREK